MEKYFYYYCIFTFIVNDYLSIAKDKIVRINILEKIFHSSNVKEYAEKIALEENRSRKEVFLAQFIGLFHDIGRFEQYTKYNVFKDTETQNHANLALNIFEKNNILNDFDDYDKNIVVNSILNHSKFKIENYSNDDQLFFSKLLRDADKLDIYNIIINYYKTNRISYRNIAKDYSLLPDDSFSDAVIDSFLNQKSVKKSDIKTVNDLKIMQLSWIFDINFHFSINFIKKNNYLNIILETIKDTDIKITIANKLNEFLTNKSIKI